MRRPLHTIHTLTSAALTCALIWISACSPDAGRPPEPLPRATTVLPTATPLPPRPVITFTPVAGDQPSPIVVQRSPEAGERLSVDGAIELVFDRAMDRDSVKAAWQLHPAVAGELKWLNPRTVRFQPAEALPRGTTYDVALTQDARAQDGARLREPYQFRFQTQANLEVGQTIPAAGAQEVQPDTVVTVLFNRPVVPLTTISIPGAALESPLQIEPPVEGTAEWLNTSILVFRPARPLPGGTVFTARIPAGIQDTDGNPLASDYVWSFSTSAPKVLRVRPDPQDWRRAPIDTAIEVLFNQNVDPASAQAAFSLLDARLSRVDGSLDVLGNTLIFTPANRLNFDAKYYVRVASGVRSASGGVGSRETWDSSFTTVPLPRIIRTEPADGERSAYPGTPFVIYFNTSIDPHTVMERVTFTPPISPTRVYTYYGDWDYSFVIYFASQPDTDYTVEIAPGIADPYGNRTTDSLRVSFHTRDLEPYAYLAVPNNPSTLNAYLPAELVATSVNVQSIDLELAMLDPADARSLTGDGEELARVRSQTMRTWRQAIDSQPNQTERSRISLAQAGGTLAPGIYLLRATSPDVPVDRFDQRVVLVVSEINLVLKAEPTGALVWATDLKTGQPVPGLSLKAFQSRYGRPYQITPVGQGVTDNDGVARITYNRAVETQYYYDSLFVLAEGRFGAVSSQWGNGVGAYEFDIGAYAPAYAPLPGRDSAIRAFLYTERPIYRPGQTVYLRGIVRAEDDVRYSLPPVGQEVRVQVSDADGQPLLERALPIDEYGAFHTEVSIPPGAGLGRYSVNAEMGGYNIAYTSFSVSNYRPPEYEVAVEPAAAEIARQTALSATVTARYLSGGALRGATVQWNVLASPAVFDPPQLDEYTFSDSDDPWRCFDCWYGRRDEAQPAPLLDGAGVTDERGRLALTLPITSEIRDRIGRLIIGPVSLSIEANVIGANNQIIAGRSSVLVHPGSFYLGIALSDYLLKASRPATIELVAVDWQGARMPGQAFEVALYRREWKNNYDEATGRWNTETIDELVSTTPLTSGTDGTARLVITPAQAGAYRIVARAVDEAGRPVQSSRFIWATGNEYVSWLRENNDRIHLVANQASFQPGETARILIPSPFAGEHWALVTVERGHILRHQLVRITSTSQVYELTMTGDFAPNVYVSVVLFTGMGPVPPGGSRAANADFKVGYLNLRVEPVQQVVSVTLTPDRSLVQPGQTVLYQLQVTDSQGRPVAGQFSLDLVDKGILNLKPRPESEIVSAFYGARGLSVQTSAGLIVSANRLMEQQEELLRRQVVEAPAAAMMDGAAEAEAMPAPSATAAAESMALRSGADAAGQQPDVTVRQDFADTAFWAPAVTTDAQGRASVSIALPDNLTTWVLRAVGVDAATRVGEGTVNVVATKPLLIRPVTPRFLTVGDVVELGAIVNNNTDAPQAVEVTLAAAGMALTTPAEHRITVPAQGEATVSWTASVEDAPQADLVFTVRNDQYSDASKPRLSTAPGGGLKINRYVTPEVVGTAGDLDSAGSRTEVVAVPPRLDSGQGELTVRLDPSLASSLQAGLNYLENYDFDSADAIVSRFLPNVLTYRALVELGWQDATLEAKLESLVTEALGRLYELQNEDGGWSWWRGEASSPHITAYAVFGLIRAREAGFDVNPAAVENGLRYLQGALVDTANLRQPYEFNRQAFILYVLGESGRPDVGRVAQLFESRDLLGIYARALLALTIGRQDRQDSRLKTLFADLNGRVIQSATGAHWEESYIDWWAMNTDTRSTAIVLSALAQLDPSNRLAPNVVRWLMASRVEGIWRTTQETAWTLIALTDWMKASGELKANYEYAAELNGSVLAQGRVERLPHTSTVVTVPMAALLAEAGETTGNRLVIGRGEGSGRLYYTAHLRAYLPVPEIKAIDRGLQVQRRYTLASCTEGPKCPEITRARLGDVIRVNVTLIAPSDLYYVKLEDPLPAGAEAIDLGLATTSQLAQGPLLSGSDERFQPYRWWWYWYSRSEMRDDRVVLFANYLSKGTYEYSYTMRATSPGQFNVIPTFANQVYFPEVFGRGDGMLFTVTR